MGVSKAAQLGTVKRLNALYACALDKIADLQAAVEAAHAEIGYVERGYVYRDKVIPAMNALRAVADEMETLTAKKYWPFPTYGDLLFSVKD